MAKLIDSFNSIESNGIAALVVVGVIIGSLFAFTLALKLLDYLIRNFKMHSKIIKKVTLILFILVLVLYLFDYFYWWPQRTRKYCVDLAVKQNMPKVRQNNYYRECLVKSGLKPESLFVNLD